MIKTCNICGGLYATGSEESFAGEPCSCRYADDVIQTSEEGRKWARRKILEKLTKESQSLDIEY